MREIQTSKLIIQGQTVNNFLTVQVYSSCLMICSCSIKDCNLDGLNWADPKYITVVIISCEKTSVYCVHLIILTDETGAMPVVFGGGFLRNKTTIERILQIITMLVILQLCLSARALAADNFPGTTISGASGSIIDTTVGMTGEAGEPATIGGNPITSQWYSWTAPSTGVVVMGTCNPTTNTNTQTDTVLAVYSGNAVNALGAAIVSDDDGCVSTVNANYASVLSFNATAGTIYRVQVDTYGNSTQGQFQLYWSYPNLTSDVAINITATTATEGGANASFTVALNTMPSGTVTITPGTSPYCTFSPASLSFGIVSGSNNWNTPQTFTVTAINNAVVDGTRSCAPATLIANGGGFTNLALTPPSFTVIDNDGYVTIANTTNGAEAGPVNGVMTLTQGGIAAVNTVVAYSVAGTASSGADYTALSGTVTIPAGSTTATINIPVIDDAIVEGPETVIVTLTSITSGLGTLGATLTATNTIADNDAATVTIANISNGTETGPVAGVMRVTQTKASSTPTVLSYSVGGTAVAGSHYTALSGTVTIAAGATTAAINIAVIDDAIINPGETVIVTLTSITSGQPAITLGATLSATNTITDNDFAAFTITDAVNTANITTPQTLTFTITVINTGTVAQHAPVITDAVANGGALTLTSGPTLSSGDAAPLGTLDIGETWVYTATYAVTQANIDNGNTITNVATFKTTEASLLTSNTTSTTITRAPQLTIVKTANTAGPVNVGTIITYTYKVTNSGNVTQKNVTVADAHNGTGTFTGPGSETLFNDAAPLGDSTDAATNANWDTLAPGDTVQFTATYVVTQHDVDFL